MIPDPCCILLVGMIVYKLYQALLALTTSLSNYPFYIREVISPAFLASYHVKEAQTFHLYFHIYFGFISTI